MIPGQAARRGTADRSPCIRRMNLSANAVCTEPNLVRTGAVDCADARAARVRIDPETAFKRPCPTWSSRELLF